MEMRSYTKFFRPLRRAFERRGNGGLGFLRPPPDRIRNCELLALSLHTESQMAQAIQISEPVAAVRISVDSVGLNDRYRAVCALWESRHYGK